MLINGWLRIVQFGFRLLYNELAFTYDWVSYIVSMGAWSCWQQASLEFLPPTFRQPILEIAHGTGALQKALVKKGYIPIGLDVSVHMGRIARRRLRRLNAHTAPKLLRARGQALPFGDESFEIIICTFPTHFIMEAATLREVHRVLAPDGQLILVMSGILTGGGWARFVLEWLYRITGQRQAPPFDLDAHWRRFGFAVRQEQVPCPRSYAMVTLLTKIEKRI